MNIWSFEHFKIVNQLKFKISTRLEHDALWLILCSIIWFLQLVTFVMILELNKCGDEKSNYNNDCVCVHNKLRCISMILGFTPEPISSGQYAGLWLIWWYLFELYSCSHGWNSWKFILLLCHEQIWKKKIPHILSNTCRSHLHCCWIFGWLWSTTTSKSLIYYEHILGNAVN